MNSELSPIDIAKGEACALADELLARTGRKLINSQCLEATAIACGFPNWTAMLVRCRLGVPVAAVIVTEKRAELLSRHLMERRGLELSSFECVEILRRVESLIAGLVADLVATGGSSQKEQPGLQPLEDK